MSNPFQASKNYSKLNFVESQLPVPSDVNHADSLNEYQSEYTSKYALGFQLKIHHMVNSPVLKVRPDFNLTEGQVLTLEMTDATHVKWKKNAGVWSAPILIVNDGDTWNTVGTSGVDAVFPSTTAAADSSEVWVAQGMRLLGGNMFDTAVGNELQVDEGHWSLCGRYVELPDKLIAGIANNDYLYFKDTESIVDHLTDPDIGHRLTSGAYASISPTATKHTYNAMSSAVFPDNTSTSKYIILGKASVAGIVVTPTFMWSSPYDLQKVVRDYGDTEAPAIPVNLATDTGSELEFQITGTPAMSAPLPLAYLEMSCDPNTEPDISFYEFKVMKLAIDGVTATTDVQTYAVYPNIDAGGMGIPTGIKHVVHNQLSGTKFKVWVRVYDKSGNISDWSASVTQEVGGVCAIGGAVAAPDVTLTNIDGFPGFGITIDTGGTWPAGGFGYRVWIADGAYPNIAIDEGLEGDHLKAESTLKIPFTEMSYPHVRIKCFDNSGLLQNLHSEDSLNVAITLESGISSHNLSTASHGGIVGDCMQCQTPYGSIYRWLQIMAEQGFDLANVYIVAEHGSPYNSVAGALSAVALDKPTRALVLVTAGVFDTGTTITFPLSIGNSSQVTIQGMGGSVINGDLDLSNVDYIPAVVGHYHGEGNSSCLTMSNLIISASSITATKTTGTGAITFHNCYGFDIANINPLIDFNAGTGKWYLNFHNCFFVNEDIQNVLKLTGNVDFFMEDTKLSLRGDPNGTALYFNNPGGRRLLKNVAIEVKNVAAGGETIDASAPATKVTIVNSSYNKAPSANINVDSGTVNTNTVITGNYICG